MASFSKKATAAASLAILAASAIPGAQAYVPADVCSMDVILQYWDAGVISGTPIVFPIANGNDKDSINIDGMTTAELELQPGDVTIQVQGKLCSSHPDFVNDGITIAWDTGTPVSSAAQTINGQSGVTAITLVALDQQTQETMDLTLDYNPIITSVAVSPAIGTYNNPSVFTFTAVDPANDAVISEYHLESVGSGNQLQVSQFEPTSDNTADDPFDAQKCQTDNLVSCDIQYQPALPDAGNFEWTLTVTDDTGNQDDVTGFFAVNAAGSIDLTINNWHIPVVDSVTTADNLGAATSEIQFGKSGILTFEVTDPDITNGLEDSLTLAVNSVTTLQTLSEGSQGDAHGLIGCPAIADITIVNTGTVGNTVTFSATWEPWAAAPGTAADYGETWCEFEFEVTDTATSGPLTSDLIEYTMAAIGTETTAGEAEELPHFLVMFISDTAPVELDVVTVSVTFEDPDSLTTFSVTHAGVLDSVTWATEESTTDVETGIDSQSGSVTRVLLMTMHADAASAGDKSVVLTLMDEDDNSLVDTRTITFSPVADSISRSRRNAAAPEIPTSQMTISLDGTNMEISTSAIQGREPRGLSPGNGNGNGNGDAIVVENGANGGDDSAENVIKLAPTTVGALVGCAVIAVVLVGVVVLRNTVRRGAGADADAKFEEAEVEFMGHTAEVTEI